MKENITLKWFGRVEENQTTKFDSKPMESGSWWLLVRHNVTIWPYGDFYEKRTEPNFQAEIDFCHQLMTQTWNELVSEIEHATLSYAKAKDCLAVMASCWELLVDYQDYYEAHLWSIKMEWVRPLIYKLEFEQIKEELFSLVKKDEYCLIEEVMAYVEVLLEQKIEAFECDTQGLEHLARGIDRLDRFDEISARLWKIYHKLTGVGRFTGFETDGLP